MFGADSASFPTGSEVQVASTPSSGSSESLRASYVVLRRSRSRTGVPETIKLETVAAREAVNALNLTQKDLRHLKREFDEIDVDQSGP